MSAQCSNNNSIISEYDEKLALAKAVRQFLSSSWISAQWSNSFFTFSISQFPLASIKDSLFISSSISNVRSLHVSFKSLR